MRAKSSQTTTSVASTPGDGGLDGGPIRRVLVLNQEADAALGALLYNLESFHDSPGLRLAPNHMRSLLDLRATTYGV